MSLLIKMYLDLMTKMKNILFKITQGQHIASNLDWIIKGIKGEIYPCKPDIFEATYEEVS